jgi:hypothetical protein
MKRILPRIIALLTMVAATCAAQPLSAAVDAAPSITSIGISSIVAGATPVFVINGNNFIVDGEAPGVAIVINGTPVPLDVISFTGSSIQVRVTEDSVTAAGAHLLRVTNDDGSDSKPITVSPAALSNLIVRADLSSPTPFTPTLAADTSIVLFAVGRDRFNNRVPDVPVNWGTFSGGTLVASTPFTATFKAGTSAGLFITDRAAFTGTLQADARILITPGPFVSLVVLPALGTVNSGAQITFTATGIDAFGNSDTARNVAWSSDRAAGTIGATSGRFSATGPIGLYNNAVTATLGAVSANAAVNIIGAPPREIRITPAAIDNPGMAMGTTRLFTATLIDASGDPSPGPVAWSSTIGAIVSSGPLTAVLHAGVAAGSGAISAAVSGLSASAPVVVVPALTPLMSANPVTLTTNGRASTTLILTTTSTAGPLGPGVPVSFSYVAANDRCVAEPSSGVTAATGTFTTVLRCAHTTLSEREEQIRATLTLGVQPPVSGDVTIVGRFQPFRMLLPGARRDLVIASGNNITCAAYPLALGDEIGQRADNGFSIYKHTAVAANAQLIVQNFRANGAVVYVYRVVSMPPCPAATQLGNVQLVQQAITPGTTSFTIPIAGMTAGTQYVIAVEAKAPLSSEVFRVRLAP